MAKKSHVLMQKYEIGKLLGKGNFGKVYHGRSIESNQSVAIKVLDKEKFAKVGLVDQIKREISIMRIARHPNIIYLHEVMATKSKIYFVLENAKGGELFDKVAKGKLKEDIAHKYFQQLINAVDFCHSRGVYHRDLKPENLLLDENENLKVSDFGLSALTESVRQDGLLHTICGTPAYVAPEVINRKGYDGAKADIWSSGVVLYVLLAGYLPFQDSNLMELYRKIEKAEFKFPHWFPRDACRLLSRMLDPNPETRISIDRIKESSWFKKDMTTCTIGNEIREGGNNGKCASSACAYDEDQNISEITSEMKKEPAVRISSLNAFGIISLSSGFNLSGFFDDDFGKKETRFISRQPASAIISKLKDIAKCLNMKIRKKDGLVKLEGVKEGRKGVLCIDAEIFEVTSFVHLVEVNKSSGDTLEYRNVLKDDVRPALQDVVWACEEPQPELQTQ